MNYEKTVKIYVAGHTGLAGSAILRELQKKGYKNIIFRTHDELNLEDQKTTHEFICDEKPKVIFLAAGKVGGIHANNSYPVDFLMKNLAIQTNVIQAAHAASVDRLIFLGSSCIYPKTCIQPIKEEYLLSSELELTNRPYALAKIAGIEMCWAYNRQFNTRYLAAMPTNLYGPNDNYDLHNSHVLPALIRKIHEAKINNSSYVEIWGTGKPKREFMHSDDLANALVYLMDLDQQKFNDLTNVNNCPIINIGSGVDISISELAFLIKEIIGYDGEFSFNRHMPDGTFRKLLDTTKINSTGWHSEISLKTGISSVYDDFKYDSI